MGKNRVVRGGRLPNRPALLVAAICLSAGTLFAQPAEPPLEHDYVWLAGERVHLSEDGGQTWKDVTAGLPEKLRVADIVGLSGGEPQAIVASAQGLFRFTNHEWEQCTLNPPDQVRQLLPIWETVPVIGTDDDFYMGAARAVYALGQKRLWRTADGGETWRDYGLPRDTIEGMSGGCDGARELVYLTGLQGVYLSVAEEMHTRGPLRRVSWFHWYERGSGLPAEPRPIFLAPVADNPVHAYAVVGAAWVYATRSGGLLWERAFTTGDTAWALTERALALGPLPGTLFLVDDAMFPRGYLRLWCGEGGTNWRVLAEGIAAFDACPYPQRTVFVVKQQWQDESPVGGTGVLLRLRSLEGPDWVEVGPAPEGWVMSVACRIPLP
jgi:hypothetical protein